MIRMATAECDVPKSVREAFKAENFHLLRNFEPILSRMQILKHLLFCHMIDFGIESKLHRLAILFTFMYKDISQSNSKSNQSYAILSIQVNSLQHLFSKKCDVCKRKPISGDWRESREKKYGNANKRNRYPGKQIDIKCL